MNVQDSSDIKLFTTETILNNLCKLVVYSGSIHIPVK